MTLGEVVSQKLLDAAVRLRADDGFEFGAYQALASGKALGGLVIIQEIFGVTDQLRSVVRLYASHGFNTIIPALFDRAEPDCVVPFSEGSRGRDLAMGLDAEKVVLDVAAAARAVRTPNGVSVLGFCWGGGQALRLSSRLQLAGAVSFYGTRLTNFLKAEPSCPLLFHFGETDDHSPPDVITAVRERFPGAETHIYPAGHAFANDARDTYVAAAARAAHERSFAFLRRVHSAYTAGHAGG